MNKCFGLLAGFIFCISQMSLAAAQFKPPYIVKVRDAGYATGNNCLIEVIFEGAGTHEIGYEFERKAAGSQTWMLLGRATYLETSKTFEISGEKEGVVRMRSFGRIGHDKIAFSSYTQPVRGFCRED